MCSCACIRCGWRVSLFIVYLCCPNLFIDFKINTLDVRVCRGPECGSSNHLLITKLIVKYRRNGKGIGKEEASNHETVFENVCDVSTCFLYNLRSANELQFVRKKQTAKELDKEIKTCIHEAAEEGLGIKEYQQVNAKWWTKQM